MDIVKRPTEVDHTTQTFTRIAKQLNEPKNGVASIGKERKILYLGENSNLK